MTTAELAAPHVSYSPSTTDNSGLEIDLCPGLEAAAIDGELMRASRARNVTYRLLAFYLDELDCCQKFRDLGYSCLADASAGRDVESGVQLPVPEVLDLDHSNIPDSEMGEWFKKRMHLYEIDRSGAWVVKKSERWRSTATCQS